jgi:hypothetical protein
MNLHRFSSLLCYIYNCFYFGNYKMFMQEKWKDKSELLFGEDGASPNKNTGVVLTVGFTTGLKISLRQLFKVTWL